MKAEKARSGHRGVILVISGPSGVGKSTLCKRVADIPGLRWSVSATTRKARAGEREGVDYHFLSVEEFERRVEADDLAEYAKVYGNYYGTPRGPLEEVLEKGGIILVDVDTQGADLLRKRYGDALVTVFIAAPSEEALAERLATRSTESDAQIAGRLSRAAAEQARKDDYDVVLVNDDLEQAASEFHSLLEKLNARCG